MSNIDIEGLENHEQQSVRNDETNKASRFRLGYPEKAMSGPPVHGVVNWIYRLDNGETMIVPVEADSGSIFHAPPPCSLPQMP